MADGVQMERVWSMVGRRLLAVVTVGILLAMAIRVVDTAPVDAFVRGHDDRTALTDEERSHVIDTARAATVLVATTTCVGNMLGSGFLFDGKVVTNSHVAIDAVLIEAVGSGGRQSVPVLGHMVGDVDIAFGGPALGPSLDFADDDPGIGEPIIMSAYQSGRRHVVVEATVHGYADGVSYGIAGPVMLVDAVTAPGFSGGPVLDRRGEVVGVMQAFDSSTGLSLVIPGSSIDGTKNTTTANPVERC